jgi:hypothetical protein
MQFQQPPHAEFVEISPLINKVGRYKDGERWRLLALVV